MKLSILTVITALATSSAAFADNQQMRNLLEVQRAQEGVPSRTTTIAFYGQGRGLGEGAHHMHAGTRSETRFELRTNAHGDQFGVFVPVR